MALTLLAFLPIVLLLVLSLTWGVRQAILAAFAVTAALFFLDGGGPAVFVAGLVNAVFGTVTILMIVAGALLLYAVMEQTGSLEGLKASLDKVHPDRQVRFFFLALFMTAFFESVAGFGTPGVLVPLLLMGMGFSAPLCIAAVLLFNGLFAVSGAVGTPVTLGLAQPLDLPPATVTRVYAVAGVGVALAAVPVMALVRRQVAAETGAPAPRSGWAMLGVVMVAYAALAPWLKELTGIAAAGLLAGFCAAAVFTDRRFVVRPWVPYFVLVALLFLPKVVPPLAGLIDVEWAWTDVLGTGLDASLRPLRSPLVPFLVAAGVALYQARRARFDARPVLRKCRAVALILLPSLAITQLMLHSGGPAADTPSMVQRIASVFVQVGPAYPLLSPLLAVVGTFMTGSTTVSNVIFGPVQHDAALTLGLDPAAVLGLQLAGASLGNAVCLFNIIAAAAVVGLTRYRAILRRTTAPVLLATLVLALAGYALLYTLRA
jgi:lactate permease